MRETPYGQSARQSIPHCTVYHSINNVSFPYKVESLHASKTWNLSVGTRYTGSTTVPIPLLELLSTPTIRRCTKRLIVVYCMCSWCYRIVVWNYSTGAATRQYSTGSTARRRSYSTGSTNIDALVEWVRNDALVVWVRNVPLVEWVRSTQRCSC